MSVLESLGRFLLIIGGMIFLLGLVITLVGRIPWAGQLPGDIVVQRERFGCYFPLATSILLSILLTLLLNLAARILKR
jgi:hypothetical protein